MRPKGMSPLVIGVLILFLVVLGAGLFYYYNTGMRIPFSTGGEPIRYSNSTICNNTLPSNLTFGEMNFEGVNYQYFSIVLPAGGTVSPTGISFLGNATSGIVRIAQGRLSASYTPIKNAFIQSCGVSYCSGVNCNPNIELNASNVIDTAIYTKSDCTSSTGAACRLPGTETHQSITAVSPVMQENVPYTYKFYLADSQGRFVSWVTTLTFERSS